MSDLDLKLYQGLDEETGEVFSKILYNEGHPLEIRGNMQSGEFRDGEEEGAEVLKELVITPIALRTFRGHMFLDREDVDAIKNDPSGEVGQSLLRDWLEVYFIKDGMVCVTLFKTFGFSEIQKALTKPRKLPHSKRPKLARPTFDLTLKIGVKAEKNEKGKFYIPVINEVSFTDPEDAKMLEQFVADHNIYCHNLVVQNHRFFDTYTALSKPKGWFDPTKDQLSMLKIKEAVTEIEEQEVEQIAQVVESNAPVAIEVVNQESPQGGLGF